MGQFIAFILFMPLFYLLVTGLFNAAPALGMLLFAFLLISEGNCGGGCLAFIIFVVVLIWQIFS